MSKGYLLRLSPSTAGRASSRRSSGNAGRSKPNWPTPPPSWKPDEASSERPSRSSPTCRGFYRRDSDAVKRAITKVIFSKLHVDAEPTDGLSVIEGQALTDGIGGLIGVDVTSVTNAKSGPSRRKRPLLIS
ncbi:hypothetical protein [Saccharothrix sp. HUAS TT1]|uniref:hypothetical protein n=1 Tax=unclassified Saccharothrix TaxID=2593673 RepID=UPI00345BE7D9